MKEHIAVAEAHKLNIPTFAITDTNTDPTQVDFAIPANDDATKSIFLVVDAITKAIEEGLAERKTDKEVEMKEKEEEEVAAITEKPIIVDEDAIVAVAGTPAIIPDAPAKRPRRKKKEAE